MNRWNLKKKKWHDVHSRFVIKKQKKKFSRYHIPTAVTSIKHDGNSVKLTITPPTNFSLVDNPDPTMEFFKGFIQELWHKQNRKHFYIDSKDVEHVTVDALIYLLAIIDNNSINQSMKYNFSGNLPKNQEACAVYDESGFMQYVRTKRKLKSSSTDRMCIEKGVTNNPDIARKICKFVSDNTCLIHRTGTKKLYSVLIELLSNVCLHAYNGEGNLDSNWYIYAEALDDVVRIVFVDTGLGIPTTVKKNHGEKLMKFLGFDGLDSSLIKSAFSGDFRSQTGQVHRGNGLHTVSKCAVNFPFISFNVLSGHGYLSLGHEIITKNFNNKLCGTLYTFELSGGIHND